MGDDEIPSFANLGVVKIPKVEDAISGSDVSLVPSLVREGRVRSMVDDDSRWGTVSLRDGISFVGFVSCLGSFTELSDGVSRE